MVRGKETKSVKHRSLKIIDKTVSASIKATIVLLFHRINIRKLRDIFHNVIMCNS